MNGQARTTRRASTAIGATLLCTLALAGPAAAQGPVPTPTPTPPPPAPTPTPTPTPTPPPGPVTGRLTVAVDAPYRDHRRELALRGDHVTVTGTLRPYVAGQKAIVRVRSGTRTLATRKVQILPGSGGRGVFSARVRLWRPGSLTVQASHRGTRQLRAARSRLARVLVATPRVGYGSSGSLVRVFQRRLRALRYEARVTGLYDAPTSRAIMAWRKVNRRARLYTADATMVRRVLAGRGGWSVRHPRSGHHVEADISLQALALIDGDRVQHVYPTSSGAPATPTVLGAYRFYSKTPGTNAKGMVDSNYFIGGYAIHGYIDVPPYNASHGCLRVPIPDAGTIYNWIRLGDRIFVEP